MPSINSHERFTDTQILSAMVAYGNDEHHALQSSPPIRFFYHFCPDYIWYRSFKTTPLSAIATARYFHTFYSKSGYSDFYNIDPYSSPLKFIAHKFHFSPKFDDQSVRTAMRLYAKYQKENPPQQEILPSTLHDTSQCEFFLGKWALISSEIDHYPKVKKMFADCQNSDKKQKKIE